MALVKMTDSLLASHKRSLKELIRSKAFLRRSYDEKPFKLASGDTSRTFFDCKLVTQDPQGIKLIIPFIGLVDLEAYRKRLQKEIEQNQTEVARLQARLSDQAFLTKAPAAVIDKERDKLAIKQDKLERLKQQLDRFN